jgi:hypothetical protein
MLTFLIGWDQLHFGRWCILWATHQSLYSILNGRLSTQLLRATALVGQVSRLIVLTWEHSLHSLDHPNQALQAKNSILFCIWAHGMAMTQSTRLVVNQAQILNHVARHRNNHFTGRITAFFAFYWFAISSLAGRVGCHFPPLGSIISL